MSDLAQRLAARAAAVDGTVCYTVLPLDGGPPIRQHGERALPTASAIKVPLLAALYAADVAGAVALDERVDIDPSDVVGGSGVLKLCAAGARLTLRDHARLMIVVSDNIATNVVIRALGGPAGAHAAIQALPLPLPATELRDAINFNRTDAFAVSSPDDFTALLAAIHAHRCTGDPAHDDEVYWTLRRQQHRGMLARHLPMSPFAEELGVEVDERCGNKSGVTPGVRVDVGLVETRRRGWALAVQIEGPPDFDLSEEHPYAHCIADLSRLVYEAWGR
jgi:beta-lactamase class A